MIQLSLTLKMTTAQVVETLVTVNNSRIHDYIHSTYLWNKLYVYVDGNSKHLMWKILWLVLAKTGFLFFHCMAE